MVARDLLFQYYNTIRWPAQIIVCIRNDHKTYQLATMLYKAIVERTQHKGIRDKHNILRSLLIVANITNKLKSSSSYSI